MESNKDLKIILSEALNSKNLNHESLARVTGIPENYICAIQNIEIDKLPPKPYIRGYLKKITRVLNLNYDEIWALYQKELTHKTSGEYDKLPENRFLIKNVSKEKQLGIIFCILIFFYIIFDFSRIIGVPEIAITNPNEPVVVISTPMNANLFIITGTAEPKNKLTINGEEIAINPDGTFSKELKLAPGENNLEFKVNKFLGREKTVIRKILYQPTNNY